jgi:alanine dehydrogenase
MKIGIIKEFKTPPDKRVVFSPTKCIRAKEEFPQIEFLIQKSEIRSFSDKEYEDLGLSVVEDLSMADILIGVKEVPIDKLIPNKPYFFFSHTIKKQAYNKKLLQAILEKNIQLHDYETIVNKDNIRLIGFGYFAGVIGTYNGLRALGLKQGLFNLPKACNLKDRNEFNKELDKIILPNIKIVLTGKGRVSSGAKEVLDYLKIKQVGVDEFLNNSFDEPVYVNIDVLDYNSRTNNNESTMAHFYENPQEYSSTFIRFCKSSDMFIAGHYHNPKAPKLISKQNISSEDFNIKVIADISCDIDGPIASTIRPSTIENPIYGYDPIKHCEIDYMYENAVVVMAVDNLPCELPRDSSEAFADMFIKHVLPAFFNNDSDLILEKSKITQKGKLTPRFDYLQDFLID